MAYTGLERRQSPRVEMPLGSDATSHGLYYRHHRRPQPAAKPRSLVIPITVAAAIAFLGMFISYQSTQWSECRQTQDFATCWDQFH